MIRKLKNALAGMPSVKSHTARRTTLTLESLEARENLSTFVPGTHELAANNVQYLNASEEILGGSGVYYYRDGYGDVFNWNGATGHWNLMFTGVKEFAVCTATANVTDYFTELDSDGNMRWGFTFKNNGFPFWSTYYQNGGWDRFQMGPKGEIDSLAASGFFAHWSGLPDGTGFGGNPTIELANVAKFEVAPNGTLYTLQYSGSTGAFDIGSLAGWSGKTRSFGQTGVNNFAVDSYSNIVSVDGVGDVYVYGSLVGSDSLPTGYNMYANDGHYTWRLWQDNAGNLTWHRWSPGVDQPLNGQYT
jgi:hypothetical protein